MSNLQPTKLIENRVWRSYRGGKLLDAFHGHEDGSDGFLPEDWLASVVTAINPERADAPEQEGLSKTETAQGSCYLKDLILQDPEGFLGSAHRARFGENFGVLTKFLDAAERLPIQVHPDKIQAKRLFQSDYGKTEAWYILEGRVIDGVEPYILLGFQEDVPREQLQALFAAQDIAGLEALMHRMAVRPGEVYLIEGGTPHAIGSGCFMLEIQEPTDYTISLERRNAFGEDLPEFFCHMGVGLEKMFDCFHYEGKPRAEMLRRFRLKPQMMERNAAYTLTALITYENTACFALNRIDVHGPHTRRTEGGPSALVVVAGEGKVGPNAVRRGDCLFVPAGEEAFPVEGDGLVLLECLPPAG